MLQTKTPIISWGIGLSQHQERLIQSFLGDELVLTSWGQNSLPGIEAMEADNPCLLWVSSRGQKILSQQIQDSITHLELLPKVLLLDDSYTIEDFETAYDSGITDIVRPPLTAHKVQEVMHKALEAQTVHYDMACMTREIMLERELLERKNDLLKFLVNFLTRTSHSPKIEDILESTFQGLGTLFPVHALHAALWQKCELDKENSVTYYINARESSEVHQVWAKLLQEQVHMLTGENFSTCSTFRELRLSDQKADWINNSPDLGSVIYFPITTGTEKVGVLAIVTEMDRSLGRDQAVALDSALRHLALTVKTSLHLKRMQEHADFDSLTGIHNRRHLDLRLKEESDRFTRYAQPLAFLLLDIDHFKQVNDTHGHMVGDQVLREVASLIQGTIRVSDYCARYGGEEFAIILPHTDAKKAHNFAERLRKKIAGHTLFANGMPLNLTVSIGVSTLLPGMKKVPSVLIDEADSALYVAKNSGRNMTRTYVLQSGFTTNESSVLAG